MFFRRTRCIVLCFAAEALLFASLRTADAAEILTGDQIYSSKCARCHGPHGEGTEHTTGPLAGDLSVAQLGDVIVETMPEDDPGTLSDNEASTVAAYIHDAFYSSIARARNQPARISLARLTVRQYRRAVADLINSFRAPSRWGDERGLRGTYFRSREPNNRKERVVDRVDPQVDFDFGTAAPVDHIDEPRRFSIRWTGSVSPPETGDYEFIVRTEHAARLWINDEKNPLIDAWVKSGADTEYKASVYLVAGQAYSLRLDFSKAKLGVDDSDKEDKKKKKPPSPPASIALLWQRPHSVAEPIPTRFLSPVRVPESFVCTVPFPPDDRSYGWERGSSVSAAWDEATTAAAIEAAGYVVDHVDELAGRTNNPASRPKRLLTFCRRFARVAFRRPFDDELRRAYIDRQFEETDTPQDAVRRVVLLVLKSPRFLFREVGGDNDAYDTAARLSFGLWDSIPDSRLLAAARDGKLETADQIHGQAERMIVDLRARAKLQRFLLTWLNVDGEFNLSKDAEKFPGFDDTAVADLRASLELFLDDVLWSETSDYRNLFLSSDTYVNNRLAQLYGRSLAASAGSPESKQDINETSSTPVFTKTKLDDHRAGVLTHPYIMARFSHRDETSPILRGVFLARGILGQSLRPPPQAITPIPPELHPDLTTRERVTLQTRDAACMTCHHIINPLGFALERFDAIGCFRDLDNGKPIDATVEYRSADGTAAKIDGARELAQYLAASNECHAAFVEQLFHHLVQQPVQAYGLTTLDDLSRTFTEQNFNIRQLAIEIMVASTPKGRETKDSTAKN